MKLVQHLAMASAKTVIFENRNANVHLRTCVAEAHKKYGLQPARVEMLSEFRL